MRNQNTLSLMKNKLYALFFLCAVSPSISLAQGSIENPAIGSTESGIGIISGWHCTASKIDIFIDGALAGFTYTGSSRADTAAVCNGKSSTGYSYLINFNSLSRGEHTIKVLADGVQFGERVFNTIQSGGQEFLSGAAKQVAVADFPSAGANTTLTWSESKQSFVVTSVSNPSASGVTPSALSDLQGSYVATVLPGSNHLSYEKAAGSKINISVTPTSVSVDGRVFTWDEVGDYVKPDVIKYLDGRPDAPAYALKVTGSRNSYVIVSFLASNKQPVLAQLYEPLYSVGLFGGWVYFDFGK